MVLAVGDISGVMCDQYGVEVGPGKLQEVLHLPDGKFNLFSVSKLQNEGWLLHGDKDRIWMTKEQRLDTKRSHVCNVLQAVGSKSRRIGEWNAGRRWHKAYHQSGACQVGPYWRRRSAEDHRAPWVAVDLRYYYDV